MIEAVAIISGRYLARNIVSLRQRGGAFGFLPILRYRKDTLERAPNSQPSTFLSEIVQNWTAIYPELTHHQKVQSTLKPILPQGSDHLSEDVPGCLTNARKRLGTERWCPFWS
jgi:hypothetical protein